MAQKVVLVDDIDGSEGASRVLFGLAGAAYEIDLSPQNEAKLKAELAPFLAAARRLSGRRVAQGNPPVVTATTSRAAGRRADLDRVRNWARTNGMTVSDRGRVAKSILDAYDNAAPGPSAPAAARGAAKTAGRKPTSRNAAATKARKRKAPVRKVATN